MQRLYGVTPLAVRTLHRQANCGREGGNRAMTRPYSGRVASRRRLGRGGLRRAGGVWRAHRALGRSPRVARSPGASSLRLGSVRGRTRCRSPGRRQQLESSLRGRRNAMSVRTVWRSSGSLVFVDAPETLAVVLRVRYGRRRHGRILLSSIRRPDRCREIRNATSDRHDRSMAIDAQLRRNTKELASGKALRLGTTLRVPHTIHPANNARRNQPCASESAVRLAD